ncbi:hypothetical protein [Rummeliibacillus sp. POC4]|uniref:hypothetical protein n=1 Tax=Rummeliibacillus sp. POC4 TaxID=2305899 RepID=UPI000E666DA3|nr:hypothetical protein [Rummeliibacillus sp. POC4]RIJ65498.1 hypothetical protein D1606_07970 [Rummeliibacillus sp. POC4]
MSNNNFENDKPFNLGNGSNEDPILIGKRQFYFAKINIHGNIFKPNLEELIETEIPRVIKSATDIKMKKRTLSFTDINEDKINNRSIILGNVTTSKFENLRVKDGQQTYFSKPNKELASSSMFIYDLEKEIIAFESTGKINLDQFIKFFTQLLSQDEIVGEVVIKVFPEEYHIIKELQEIEKIKSIKFNLIHPNPRSKHYNMYEKMVTDTGAKKVDITLRDEREGLDVLIEGSEIKTQTVSDGVAMVESGYGDLEIHGENYTFVPSGKKRKTKKRITQKKSFNSKKSKKHLTFTNEKQGKIVSKVVQYIADKFE